MNVENEIIESIKYQIHIFINDSNVLKDELNIKEKLIDELFNNLKNKDFYGKWHIERAIELGKKEFIKNQEQISNLWKKVVIKNSSLSNTPEITANNVVKEYKKNFN